MEIVLASEPETKHQVINRSLHLYRQAFSHIFILSLFLAILVFVPTLLSFLIGDDIFSEIPLISPHRLWMLVINLSVLVFFAAILWRIRCLITNKHESIGDDMWIGLKKLPAIFVAFLIQSFIMTAIILLFSTFIYYIVIQQQLDFDQVSLTRQIIAGVLFAIQMILVFYSSLIYYFAFPIIVLENKNLFRALIESAYVILQNIYRILYVQLTPWIALIISLIIVKSIAYWISPGYFYDQGNNLNPLGALIYIGVAALFIPWIATTLMTQLRDLELRKEPIAAI